MSLKLYGSIRSSEHQSIRIFSSRVAEFCLEAGWPAVERGPMRDIKSLRHYLLSHNSLAHEVELRKEIDELRNANRFQQRIITNLACRHVLEALPAQTT